MVKEEWCTLLLSRLWWLLSLSLKGQTRTRWLLLPNTQDRDSLFSENTYIDRVLNRSGAIFPSTPFLFFFFFCWFRKDARGR
jgi:hypothetical protein